MKPEAFVRETKGAETQPRLMACHGKTDSQEEELAETNALTAIASPVAVEVVPKPTFAEWLADSINGRPPGERPQLEGPGDTIAQIQHIKQNINNINEHILELLEYREYDEAAELEEEMRYWVIELDEVLKGVHKVEPQTITSATQPNDLIGEAAAKTLGPCDGSGLKILISCPICTTYHFAVCEPHHRIVGQKATTDSQRSSYEMPLYDDAPLHEFPFTEEEILAAVEKRKLRSEAT